jgi:FlgD Ig-like domain/GEVED domain
MVMIPRAFARTPTRASAALSAAFPGFFLLLLPVLLLALLPAPAAAQINPGPGDWGDAPEGVVAYPSLGVIGNFPTCFGGPAGFVWHGNPGPASDAYWGPTVDTELDGNAGICPPPPYEQDECWGPFDGDGGLVSPDTYSIVGGIVVPCGQVPPRSLGTACQSILPGSSFDARLTNNTNVVCFANVLFDWNQDGQWGGSSMCGAIPAPEHAIQNVPIPPGFSGLLSTIYGGAIQIGPNSGYVWVRLSIMDAAVPQGWIGAGTYPHGETEDYLVRIDPNQGDLYEYGDAPEGVPAYPSGVLGQFPTCLGVGAPGSYVRHGQSNLVGFGPTVDWETDGNANVCPAPPYDQDECNGSAGDAGILFPMPITLTPAATPTVCANGNAGPDLTGCFTAKWGVDIDIYLHNSSPNYRLVSVLADWDGDGKWTTAVTPCPGSASPAHEQVLLNWTVPAGYTGSLSGLAPPDFRIGDPPENMCWMRFTLHDLPVPANWDGSGTFSDGETEDYLFRISEPPVDAPELGESSTIRRGLELDSVRPNPTTTGTTVSLSTDRAGQITVNVYDAAGRLVNQVSDRWESGGPHDFTWDGRDASNRQAVPGVYFVRATQAGKAVTAKVVRVK